MQVRSILGCRMAGMTHPLIGKWLRMLLLAISLTGAFLFIALGCAVAQQYSITVNAGTLTNTINSNIMGANVLWLSSNAMLKDTAHPEYGVRDDVSQFSQACGVSVMCFPGGDAGENYHWRYGVGPVATRTMDVSPGYGYMPYFGTDEFMDFAAKIGCKHKVMLVNLYTGTPQEAANWVEYCNSPSPRNPDPSWTTTSYAGDQHAPTGYFAWLRKQFGHSTPYNVEYWVVGNEDYKYGYTPEQYGAALTQYASAIKAVDPKSQIGAVSIFGSHYSGMADWNIRVLEAAAPSIDFMALHNYSDLWRLTFDIYLENGTATRNVYFPQSGTYTFTLTAFGIIAYLGEPPNQQGVAPQAELDIDGLPVATWDVTVLGRYQTSSFVTAGYHQVSYAFTNQYWSPDGSIRRQLYVYGVSMSSASMAETNIWYPDDAEQQLLFNDPVVLSTELSQLKGLISNYSPSHPISIFITEGAMAYPSEGSVRGYKYPKEEIRHTLRHKSALWQAGFMNTLIKQNIPLYCRWLLFDDGDYGDIRDPGVTTAKQPLVIPRWYTMKLYSQLGGTRLASTSVTSLTYSWPAGNPVPYVYNGSDTSFSLPTPANVPYLDAIASETTNSKYLYLMVTNRSRYSATTSIRVSGFKPTSGTAQTLAVWTLVSRPDRIVGNRDPEMEAFDDTMTSQAESLVPDTVNIATSQLSGVSQNFTYTFRPYSVTLIRMSK